MNQEIISLEKIEKEISSLTKFEQTIEDLKLLVSKTKDITANDLRDEN